MITPDYIAPWLAIPAGLVLTVSYFLIEIRHAKPDPDPQYSAWDMRDGLTND